MGGRFNQEHLQRSEVGSDYQNEPDSDQSTNGSDLWKVNWLLFKNLNLSKVNQLFFQNLDFQFFLKSLTRGRGGLTFMEFLNDEWNRMIDASKIWDPKNEWECGISPLSLRWKNGFPDFIVIKIVFLQPRQLPGLWRRWGRWDQWWKTGWTQCFALVLNS